jgi:hypothetical protein
MTEHERVVEKEIVVATEPAGASQKSLGRPMVMLLILIGVAIAGIGITVAVLSK